MFNVDVQGFENFYRTNFKIQVDRLAAYCFDRSGCEEILQETYLKAWVARDSFTSETHLQAWMFAVAKNLAFSKYRKFRSEVDLDEKFEKQLVAPSTHEFIQKELLADAAIRVLDEDENATRKNAIQLHYFKGLKTDEIGMQLGINQSTVLSHLRRFRIYAKEKLSIEGLGSPL